MINVDLCQKRSDFGIKLIAAQETDLGARHLSDGPSAFSYHTCSHLSSHLT